ncbi:hypothetical protein SAMN03159343_3488 [Klenkia marina]|uniref:YacP-like NYN domain-containing protein n=1 Tax=Klenkia marina TaxID=1960309 RepID=A0A1G4YTH4_9ACTN|nr:hypothetical protein [Klenkia marina]SCX56720.1 hypothetical protein SAMN03159343_3488 [Klenkia marina]
MTLLVDVANVVGSRPDGWWRDRAGATSRLLVRLATLDDDVVAVVEGRARDVPEVPGVRLVRATGSGDDALVAVLPSLGEPVVVVTADRGLRERLPAGTAVHGPGWLLDRL